MLKSSVVTLRDRLFRTMGPDQRILRIQLNIHTEIWGIRALGYGSGGTLRKWFDSQIDKTAEASRIDPLIDPSRLDTADNAGDVFSRAKKLVLEPIESETPQQDQQDLENLIYYWIQHDLQYATSLIHLATGRYDVTISNEVWLIYASRVCEECDLDGARTVFHELIDNWKLFTDDSSPSSSVQTRFAFLLTPSMLEGLSVVFQRHGEPDYIVGLRDYFKRFFSVYGHRTCYKTINVSLVEAYSVKQEFSNALSAFRFLSMMFRDHKTFMPRQQFLEAAHTSAKGSYEWRINNLKTNTVRYPEYEYVSASDNLQKRLMDKIDGQLYDPVNTHNDTTRLVPTLNGLLQLNDLPNFSALLNQYVVKHMEKNDETKVQKLVQTIQQTHFMLNSFVINSLAINFYLEEAFLVMKKLPYKNHNVLLTALFKDDMFLVVMKSCKAKLTSLLSNELSYYERITELTLLMNNIMHFYYRVRDKMTSPEYNSQVVETFMSAMLSTPRLSTALLLEHLDKYRKVQHKKIYLDEESFATLSNMFESAVYNDVVAVRKPN